MVTRRRLRSFLTALALYAFSALAIAYFAFNAYTGQRGLLARQEIAQQIVSLNTELAGLKDERSRWERRIALLKSDRIDPDLLDERARDLLGFVGPKDIVILRRP
jgi:cell division protein FtsB